MQPDADLLLKNYIEVVRRDIVEDQLLEVCNDIYNRHTKALDLIFKFKSSERSNVTKWISETLESLSNSNKEVVYNNKGKGSSVKFRLKTIDDILMGAFPHDNITEIYFFAFKFKRGKKEIRIRWHKTKNIDSNIIKEIAYSLTQTDRDSDIKAVTNWKEYTDSKENIEKIVKESIDELLHKINILKGKIMENKNYANLIRAIFGNKSPFLDEDAINSNTELPDIIFDILNDLWDFDELEYIALDSIIAENKSEKEFSEYIKNHSEDIANLYIGKALRKMRHPQYSKKLQQYLILKK